MRERPGAAPAEQAGTGAAQSNRVRALFDAKAATWPGKYAPDGRLAGRLTQLTAALWQHVPGGGQVLDLGAGTGELARHLAAAGWRVAGCDISAEMLAGAAAADPGGLVSWVRLDPQWTRLPFPSASMDAVVASSVLEYVPRPDTVLAECARVLRPGGVMICTVPDPAHPIRRLERIAAQAAALIPMAAIVARRWPRLARYLTYLEISRHRRPAGWWNDLAAGSGLAALAAPAREVARGPLRLLVFRRPGDPAGN